MGRECTPLGGGGQRKQEEIGKNRGRVGKVRVGRLISVGSKII